jgi:hypothetical protein
MERRSKIEKIRHSIHIHKLPRDESSTHFEPLTG